MEGLLLPNQALDRLENTLRQGKDSLCWSLVEDLGLNHSEVLLHQLPESLALIQASRQRVQEKCTRFSTVGAWIEGPDLMRSVFRVLSAAIAAGNEEVWLGLPEDTHQFTGLLQLLMRPTGIGLRVVRSSPEPFVASCLGQVHTLLVQGEPRWIEGWEPVFARWGMRVQFEGPGHDAMMIFGDADPDRAAELILEASLRNSGRDPSAPHRIYTAHSIYSRLSQALIRQAGQLRLGPPQEATSDLGPLPEEDLRAVLERLDQAFSDGARVQYGGEPIECTENGKRGLPPTIVTGCRPQMDLVREPCRGPLIALVGFDDTEEGIQHACASRGGHALSILGASDISTDKLSTHYGRIFRDSTPFREESYGERIRWGADASTSWIWEPMPDGRLARRAGAHDLVTSLLPFQARPQHPGVVPPSDEARAVQGLAGPDGLIMLPG
jgi:hypothetical protein